MANRNKGNGGMVMANDVVDYKFKLLTKKMETAQAGCDIYNRTMFAVKGLALTLLTVFVTLYTGTADNLHPLVFVGVILVLLLLWVQDATFKRLV